MVVIPERRRPLGRIGNIGEETGIKQGERIVVVSSGIDHGLEPDVPRIGCKPVRSRRMMTSVEMRRQLGNGETRFVLFQIVLHSNDVAGKLVDCYARYEGGPGGERGRSYTAVPIAPMGVGGRS